MRLLVLMVGALFISTGCVAMPGPETFNPYNDKPKSNVRGLLGGPDTDKPVRVGRSREQLHSVLGTPYRLSADTSIESYGFSRHYGFKFGVIPLGHFWGDQTAYDDFDLVLRFDPDDRLSSWEFGDKALQHGKAGETQLYYVDRGERMADDSTILSSAGGRIPSH